MARPKNPEETTNPARGRTMASATEAALAGEITRSQWAEAGFPPAKYPTGGKAEAAPKAESTKKTASRTARTTRASAKESEDEKED